MPHEIRGVDVKKYALLCQESSPKRWFGNMEMTSNCDVTNSAHQKQITTIWPWTKSPHENFLRTPLLAVVLKLVKTVLTSLPFCTLCPNRLNLFGHFRINSVNHWKKPGKNYVQNYQRVPAESLKKGGPEETVSRSPSLTSTPAHRGWWKWMEADHETGACLVWLWLLHSAAALRQGFFRKQVTCLGIISQLQIRSIVNGITI